MPTIIISENTTGTYIGTNAGVEETYINSLNATTNYGSGSTIQVQNNSSYTDQSRALLRFTLPAALNGATISAVRLRLYHTDGGDGGNVWAITVHEMLRAWVEAQATYNVYSTGNNWATAGGLGTGDYDATVLATKVIGSGANFWHEITGSALTALVQAKATASASLLDLLLRPENLSSGPQVYVVFRASEGTDGQRPVLEVDYTTAGPTLSSPSGSVTGNTAATITASTDTLSNGTMHFLRRTGGSAASAATIISTGESQATSGSNPQSKSVTLLGGTANQYVDIAQDGTSGDSNVVTVGPLTTATTLSAPTGTATGNTTATVGFTTDRAISAAFPAYFLTLPAADSAPADAATLIANGATVSQTTGGTTPTRALTGLTTATAYRTHMCQPGSNVVSSASYTPSTMTYSGTIGPQGGVQGAAHVWSGVAPSTLFSGGIGTKSYSGTGLGASGLTVNATTGQLQGTYGTPGTYNVAIVGTDQSTAGSEIPQTETSNTFTLTITATGSPPTVATNPSNLTVTDGATASFTASFNGSPIPSLQWQEFIAGVWTAMSGQTSNVLALGAVDLTDSGRSFRLGGTNVNGGPVYTASATLTVTPAAVGTITSDIFAGWGDDTPIASTTINFVKIERVSTGAIVLELTSQVTGTDGRLIITNAAITPGVEYMLWCRNTAGTIRGGKKYTAT